MRHDRRCFGRLEQQDQRLKKHYGRWMDIVRSLELESFILTKVDKGPRPSQLSRPTSQPPTMVGPSQQGEYSIFLCVIRRHFLACQDIAGGSDLSAGGTFSSRNTEALPMGPSCHVEESVFCA